jgi:hypothetical protein
MARRIFSDRDRRILSRGKAQRDVPSDVTVSQFFETIARTLLQLEQEVLKLLQRRPGSN